MRIVLKRHTGVVVHWGKDDSLGDVCNALETLLHKKIVESFMVTKNSELAIAASIEVKVPGGAVGLLERCRQILIDGDFVQTGWEIPSMITHECDSRLLNWEGTCETVLARTYNPADIEQLRSLSRTMGNRIELEFCDGRLLLDGVPVWNGDIVVIGETEPCTMRVEVLGEKLDDKDLAEKFGGDRVEFVNRHSWAV